MSEIVSRRKIMRACKSRGWMVQSAALAAIHDHLNLLDGDYLDDVIEELSQRIDKNTKLITEPLWNEILQANEGNGTHSSNKDHGDVDDFSFELVNAFKSPRLTYDCMRKIFRVEEKHWSLFGSVPDKINMMAQRYAMVQQRMLRHDLFRRKNKSYHHSSSQANNHVAQQQQHTITPIESLLGKQDSGHTLVVVLGILTQVEEGKFYLEDPTGQVQVSFSEATAVEGFYVTENSILLIEATFQDEVLHVSRVGPPFPERREKSLQVLQQQVRHPHFLPAQGRGIGSAFNDSSPLVVLSDIHLDQPRVLTMLEDVFQEFETKNKMPVFCLMGNFRSNPRVVIPHVFEDLAILISKFPRLARHAHFVFVRGPMDTDCAILPQPPLIQETLGLEKTMQSYQIEHVHWATNPCRIRQNGKEIVLFRCDVLAWMLQNQVRTPFTESNDRTPHSRMAKTILDQGHLLPVARAPIYWNSDHALRMYPLPDALVLGGSTSMEYYEIYEGCDTIHPGCFSKNGKYAIYNPHKQIQLEGFDNDNMSIDSSDQEHGRKSRVEFSQGTEKEN